MPSPACRTRASGSVPVPWLPRRRSTSCRSAGPCLLPADPR
jgi:hypothetical protein